RRRRHGRPWRDKADAHQLRISRVSQAGEPAGGFVLDPAAELARHEGLDFELDRLGLAHAGLAQPNRSALAVACHEQNSLAPPGFFTDRCHETCPFSVSAAVPGRSTRTVYRAFVRWRYRR